MDLSAIGRQFGLNDEQTRAALDALVPVVAAGVRKQAQSPEGLQDLLRSVLTGGFGAALDDPGSVSFDTAKGRGDDVLGQIFGNKDTSREVAQQLSLNSGIGAAVLKKLLPIVATIVMGQMAKKIGGGSGGGLGDILGGILGGGSASEPAPSGRSGGGIGDILKDVLGGGSAEPAPTPAPQPRRAAPSGGSLEDILNDILAGGQNGRVIVKQMPPGQMGDILKDILGGGAGGGGAAPAPSVERGRKTLDDILGKGTKSGDAGDDLLNSVEDAIRRRR